MGVDRGAIRDTISPAVWCLWLGTARRQIDRYMSTDQADSWDCPGDTTSVAMVCMRGLSGCGFAPAV